MEKFLKYTKCLGIIASLLAVVRTEELANLKNNCVPCVGYGFRYCVDDDNLVNLNANKCYSKDSDRAAKCADFPWLRNSLLCSNYVQTELSHSDACDKVFKPENMEYYKRIKGTMTFKPRTACGFFLNEYSAYLDIYHQFPMSLYHRDYKTVKYSDTDYMAQNSSQTSTLPGNKCYSQRCNNYYYVTYG